MKFIPDNNQYKPKKKEEEVPVTSIYDIYATT